MRIVHIKGTPQYAAAELVKAEKMDLTTLVTELHRRGWAAVPYQYISLVKHITETGFWPVLYDVEGKKL